MPDKNKSNKQHFDKDAGQKHGFPPAKGKVNPETIVNNPDMQYSGRSTDYRNIRDTGHSPGSPVSQSRDGEAGNYGSPDDEKDFNKSGQVKSTGKNEMTASDMDHNRSRPNGKYGGVQGKTMVKNTEMTDYHSGSDIQGQQQGGSHGGGAAANKKYGNQSDPNSVREKQRKTDGDYKGHK